MIIKKLFGFYEKSLRDIFVYKDEYVFPKLSDVKFGIEIEFQSTKEDIDEKDIIEEFKKNGIRLNQFNNDDIEQKCNYQFWQIKKETTCDWEITSPILQDSKENWIALERVCNVLQNSQFGFHVDENCAIHIHINRSILSCGQHYINLIEIYRYLEPLTYGISAGEDKEISLKRIKKYAATLAFFDKELWAKCQSREEINKLIVSGEIELINYYYCNSFVGLNFRTKSTNYETIEFRTFNGTLNIGMIQFYFIYVLNLLFVAVTQDKLEKKEIQFWNPDGKKYKYNKEYIDECIRILNPDIYLKTCIYKMLDSINFKIPLVLYNALRGIYSEADKMYFKSIW